MIIKDLPKSLQKRDLQTERSNVEKKDIPTLQRQKPSFGGLGGFLPHHLSMHHLSIEQEADVEEFVGMIIGHDDG